MAMLVLMKRVRILYFLLEPILPWGDASMYEVKTQLRTGRDKNDYSAKKKSPFLPGPP